MWLFKGHNAVYRGCFEINILIRGFKDWRPTDNSIWFDKDLAMGCIEVGSAFPSKFYMLYLIMTDWNMGSPKRILLAVLD